jgi:hypothetical protein
MTHSQLYEREFVTVSKLKFLEDQKEYLAYKDQKLEKWTSQIEYLVTLILRYPKQKYTQKCNSLLVKTTI